MNKKNVYNKISNFQKPISIEKFIEISLYGKDGYYLHSNVLGSKGDFVTSPEISQLFGEILGFYILNFWQKKIKKKFNLIELGPGNGTLLIDIMNIAKRFKDFNSALSIKLIEKNINLIKKQKNNFSKFNLNIDNIVWHQSFRNNFRKPIIVIANEFFDCLPINQFYKKKDTWYKKMIQYDHNNKIFKLKDIKVTNHKTLSDIASYKPLNILEISKSREKIFSQICKNLLNMGGLLITIDYGYLEKPKNFTLQSVYKNNYSNVLDNIGQQDITSLVDFKSLISIAKSYNLKIDIFTSQRDFLIQNGILERAKKILASCKASQQKIINNGLDRIIDKDNMGSIFKVLVISNIK